MSRQGAGAGKPALARARLVLRTEYPLYLFFAPAVLTVLLFSYLPMFANVIAFMDYDMLKGWMGLGSPFVGLKWFRKIFSDPYFLHLILRTVYYNGVVVVLAIPAPFVLAILINEIKQRRFKKIVQTVSYLPYFVSWVTLASLIYLFLSSDTTGIINNVKQALFGGERIIFMKYPAYFPAILTLSNIFKTTGWGAIIYLAAIASIDLQLYDAASIDGAGRWQQFLHVTFPGMLPTTMVLVILALGSFFTTNFDQVFNLQNEAIREETNTIAVYSYFYGVQDQQYSVAAAIGLFQGAVNALFLFFSNLISRRMTSHGLF